MQSRTEGKRRPPRRRQEDDGIEIIVHALVPAWIAGGWKAAFVIGILFGTWLCRRKESCPGPREEERDDRCRHSHRSEGGHDVQRKLTERFHDLTKKQRAP